MTSRVLVMMYHHIHGPAASHLAGLNGITQEAFRDQLRLLKQRYTPIGYEQLRAALDQGADLPKRAFLVTFDDGTIDHYRCAYPVLCEEGVPGVFFLIGEAVTHGALVQVHLRHLLDRALGPGRLRPLFLDRFRALGGDESILASFSEETVRRAYRWDDAETARFKYAVNFGIEAGTRNAILRDLLEEYLEDTADALGRAFYLNWDQAAEMQTHGMTFGGHSMRHEALSLLDPATLRDDLRACRDLLDKRLGKVAGRPFSYPYGKAQHFSKTVIALLRKLNFTDGFANIQGVNRVVSGRAERGRFHWRRLDPKDLPALL